MSQPDTKTDTRIVEQTLRIGARPETVWSYWTDPQRICDWWAKSAELDPRPGGTCVVTMAEGPVMRGEYIELVPHERIVFSFGWDPMDGESRMPPGSTRLEITLAADGADTVLTLRHSGIPAPLADEHDHGWSHFLSRLGEVATAA